MTSSIPRPLLPMRLSWLLVEELVLGTAPTCQDDINRLCSEGIAAVLSLCAIEEAPPPEDLAERFRCERLVLPDHRTARLPRPAELDAAVRRLAALRRHGPVLVHCVAGMERSPLVAMAWLIQSRGLSLPTALAYVQEAHPPTNPLPGQLRALSNWASSVPQAA